MKTPLILLLTLGLAACGDTKARYVIAPALESTQVQLRVATIEVQDVSLPVYASATEIVVADDAGALRPVAKSIWADDPVRAVTGALARSLDAKSTATVAAEPWPLTDSAQARLSVRVDQMLAGSDGRFTLSGQFALSSTSDAVRESLQRFSITVPMADTTPASVATATGTAIAQLADQVIAKLRG